MIHIRWLLSANQITKWKKMQQQREKNKKQQDNQKPKKIISKPKEEHARCCLDTAWGDQKVKSFAQFLSIRFLLFFIVFRMELCKERATFNKHIEFFHSLVGFHSLRFFNTLVIFHFLASFNYATFKIMCFWIPWLIYMYIYRERESWPGNA